MNMQDSKLTLTRIYHSITTLSTMAIFTVYPNALCRALLVANKTKFETLPFQGVSLAIEFIVLILKKEKNEL